MKYVSILGLLLGLLFFSFSAQAQTAPCTGSAYTTQADFFRATANGVSSDATASKKKALSAARTALSEQIQAKAEVALTTQNHFGEAERTAFLQIIQRTILQEGAHLKIICENSQKKGSRYHTTIVVELPKSHVLDTLQEQIQTNGTLKGSFDAAKFKAAF